MDSLSLYLSVWVKGSYYMLHTSRYTVLRGKPPRSPNTRLESTGKTASTTTNATSVSQTITCTEQTTVLLSAGFSFFTQKSQKRTVVKMVSAEKWQFRGVSDSIWWNNFLSAENMQFQGFSDIYKPQQQPSAPCLVSLFCYHTLVMPEKGIQYVGSHTVWIYTLLHTTILYSCFILLQFRLTIIT